MGEMTSETPKAVLEALARMSPAAIIGLNAREQVDLWSAAASDLFGWTESEVTGRQLPGGLSLGNDWRMALGPVKLSVSAKDGRVVDIELRSSRLPEGGWVLMAADTTKATRTEHDANLRVKAESRFRELLEAAPDAIIEVDREGRIVLLNAATEAIFGYRREDLLGQPVERLIPEGARGRHGAHRANYWANPVTRPMGFGMILLARRNDGTEFPVEISLSPVKIDDGFRVTAIIRDVTAKQKAEEAIRAANQQLELQNQELDRANQLKSEFLASMSHELRTPLHTIIGFTELLAEELEGPLNDKQKRFLNHVHQDSQHLLELINDILDLSKIEAGQMELHPESFDASVVVTEVLNGIRPTANARGIVLENRVAHDTVVKADRVRFREILNNLLSNAVKFTTDGGSVWVENRPTPVSREGAAMACLCVGDTGIGIAQEDHAAVFDKFRQVGSTTRGVREGTGLGLAIVKSFVEMHGGTISLESAPGEGSRFSFTVPAGDSSPPLVLVIEDDPGARELLASYLEPLGIRTESAASADEGLRMARDLKPDAITLDLLLPGKSGWRVLRELRAMAETSGIPVFVVSVLDQSPAMVGVTEYLQKPLRKEALLQALRRHAPARFAMI
jgi:PAS domain S-box-containing protein